MTKTLEKNDTADSASRADDILVAQRDLSLALAGVTNTDKAASICLETALKVSGMEAGAVFLQTEKGAWKCVANKGTSEKFFKIIEVLGPDSDFARLVLTKKANYLSSVEPGLKNSSALKKEGFLGLGLIPILHSEEVVAGITVASRSTADISESSRAALEMVAASVGSAIARIRAQEALAESEKTYRLLAENQRDVVVSIGMDGIVLYCSPAVTRLGGYDPGEVAGKSIFEFMASREEVDFARGLFSDRFASYKPGSMEAMFIPKNGDPFPVEITASRRIEDGVTVSLIGVVRDISRRVAAQKAMAEREKAFHLKMRHVQKMEAIGTLAGGIAHNFNNILAAIMGYSELGLRDIPSDNPVNAYFRQIFESSERARDLVSQILTFSRQDASTRKPQDVRPIVKDAVRLLREAVPSSIEIRADLSEESCIVNCDAQQIKQILMNLAANSTHAMDSPEGGVLEITLERTLAELSGDEQGSKILAGTPIVRLCVKDTGTGMDSDTLRRIFDPYFTTKDTGEGTGLGLAVVHGAVQNHKGVISVESAPGMGAIFEIQFPCVETEENFSGEDKRISMGNFEHVVFVDDEEPLAALGKAMLGRMNYNAAVFVNPEEALVYFKDRGDEIDLLITDQTMPGMTGEALIKEVRAIRPDIPVVACSGRTDFIDVENARRMEIQAFCSKPISFYEFSSTIRRVLDQAKKDGDD